ncbi:hypothetical protein [Actinacidiphila oryziradicis]|uniref:MmpS family membrane protein n=1 Tax=Actinacidiphila oryziradicis TaxID=2571141 RepID=A0A4U0ST41_9ACTN|nr:hypothetical protein [Actinacidiphila oryziradicis]TKA13186.1 hypothetical protein FCI23_00110 [Actinacidiphila oryziradicis]
MSDQWGQQPPRPGQPGQQQWGGGWGQPPAGPGAPVPGGPQPKKGRGKTVAIFAGSFFVVLIVVVSARGGGTDTKTASPAASPASSAPAETTASAAEAATKAAKPAATNPKPKPNTIAYVVTGSSGADVMYGPSGSSFTGHSPMSVTKPLGHPQYYSITAQLQGSGKVTCELLVNGKVMSKGTASGGYNIATCEIVDDFSGNWVDANSN